MINNEAGPRDIRGCLIEEGDTVAYAIRSGNTSELKVGTVESVRWVGKFDGGYWTWKVRAFLESGWGGSPRELPKARPSSPSLSKTVVVEKGNNERD